MNHKKADEHLDRVDVKKTFHQKNPALAPWIPGFVYRYLRKIVHEDYINEFLARHGQKKDVEFARATVDEFNIDCHVEGEENIPGRGRFIFASNHPLGGFDGMILITIAGSHFPNVKVLVNDILMNIKNMGGIFVPVNKHGGQARGNVRLIDGVLRSDAQIITFPSGLVSRKIKGRIQDLPWKKNFITQAVRYQRDVIPVHFSGRNTGFFYNLANIRKFLGIKWNLEMFYLVDEAYKHRNQSVSVHFGKPISWKLFDRSKKPAQWADDVRNLVYAIGRGETVSLGS